MYTVPCTVQYSIKLKCGSCSNCCCCVARYPSLKYCKKKSYFFHLPAYRSHTDPVTLNCSGQLIKQYEAIAGEAHNAARNATMEKKYKNNENQKEHPKRAARVSTFYRFS